MITCDNFMDKIDLYIDGLLEEHEIVQMKSHAKQCESCKQELMFAESIRSTLSNLPPIEVPSDFKQQVFAKIEKEKIVVKTPIYKKWQSYSALAACIVLFAVIQTNMWGKQNTIHTPDDILVPPIAGVTTPTAVPPETNAPTQQEVANTSEPVAVQTTAPTAKVQKSNNAGVTADNGRQVITTEKPVDAPIVTTTEPKVVQTTQPVTSTQAPMAEPSVAPRQQVASASAPAKGAGDSTDEKPLLKSTRESIPEAVPFSSDITNTNGVMIANFMMSNVRTMNILPQDKDTVLKYIEECGIVYETDRYYGTQEQVQEFLVKLEKAQIIAENDFDETTQEFVINEIDK